MTAIEYSTVDKSAWGDGAWQGEPDKVQWIDEATALDCLIVRNHGGALCGYVGVPKTHPFYGVGYSECPQQCREPYCDRSPGSRLTVHGGLTFADSCNEPTRQRWEGWRTSMHARRDEASCYPNGDAAEAWREGEKFLEDYEGWAQHRRATSVCHLQLEGRPGKVWWFGFDCAHSGDFSPKWARDRQMDRGGYWDHATYKDRAYVQGEIRQLAEQLAAVAG